MIAARPQATAIGSATPNALVLGLAEDLRALLSAAKLSSFFAPKSLPKETPQEWERGILDEGLRQSRAFVPLFSRQSLSRRWVLFEAGAAAALRLKFFITHVEGIDEREITAFPYTHHLYHYKLYSEDDLRNLVINLLKGKDGGGRRNRTANEVGRRSVLGPKETGSGTFVPGATQMGLHRWKPATRHEGPDVRAP